MRQAADLGHRLEQAQEIGLGRDDARDGALRVGQQALERLEVRRAGGGPVGDERDLLGPEARAVGVGLERLAVVRVDAARDEDPLAAGRAAGHEGRLGGRRAAVVVRGGHDVEAGQLGEQRLVLVDALQRALAHLGLVRRVGGVPLAAQQQLVDGGRRPVAVRAGAQEARQVDPVASRERREAGRELELGLGGVEPERAGPERLAGCRRTARRRSRCRATRASGPDRRPRAGRTASVSPRRSAARRPPRRAARLDLRGVGEPDADHPALARTGRR